MPAVSRRATLVVCGGLCVGLLASGEVVVRQLEEGTTEALA